MRIERTRRDTPSAKTRWHIALISLAFMAGCQTTTEPDYSAPFATRAVPETTRGLHLVDQTIDGFLNGCLVAEPSVESLHAAFPHFEARRTTRLSSYGSIAFSRPLPRFDFDPAPAPGAVGLDITTKSVTNIGMTCMVLIQSHYAADADAKIRSWLSTGRLPGRSTSRPSVAPDPEVRGSTRYWRKPNGDIWEISAGNLRVRGNNATALSVRVILPQPCVTSVDAERLAKLGYDTGIAKVSDSCG